MVQKGIGKLIAAFLLLAALPLSAQNDGERQDSLVRLLKAESLQLVEKFNRPYRKAIDATFLHSGTYLICDTALWNVDARIINAYGNVKLIQGETELSSDKLDYYVDAHLAQFRGALVQLRNKENNILRTANLDYNTADSLATFFGGGSMKDADGQVIESLNGNYDSKDKIFTFRNKVNMFTDSVFVKTNELLYDCNAARADFVSPIEFWQDDYMLSSKSGWYDRDREIFFFKKNVHAQSPQQEAWSDTMYFYRRTRDLEMRGNAQIQDTTRNVYGMADYVFYLDSTATLTMEKNAAVAMETVEGRIRDTLYFGADKLLLSTLMMFEVAEEELEAAKARKSDLMTDPVTEFRRKAAEAAAKAAEEAMKNDPNRPHPNPGQKESDDDRFLREIEELRGDMTIDVGDEPQLPLPDTAAHAPALTSDSLAAAMDTLPADAVDTLAGASSVVPAADSPAPSSDSLALADSLSTGADSLALADSLNVVRDSTKINFVTGVGRVRAFRKDMQVLCDSLRYCDLDSVARFYIDPVVWNDGNRQYSSDSLFVMITGSSIDRASLMSNAFIITMEDSLHFDQIKSTDVMAYFDTTAALRRFDALGGASAMFFLQENGAYATVNKVETKMMSALFEKGNLSRVFYFESPKNNAMPLAQMSSSELKMKGFNWRIDERPNGPQDITSLQIKPSERNYYNARPRAEFAQTDIFFPGYMASVYEQIALNKERKRQNELRRQAVRDSLARVAAIDTSSMKTLDSLGVDGAPLLEDAMADSAAAVAVSEKIDQVLADELAAAVDVSSAEAEAAVAAGVAAATAASGTVAAVLSAEELAQAKAAEKAAAKAARAAEAQARREQAELARTLRIAERDARWARLDSLDAAKAAAKEQKKLDRKREKTRDAYRRQLEQKFKDDYKLQLQIQKTKEKYLKQQMAKDRRASRKVVKKTVAAPAEVPEAVNAITEEMINAR